MSFSHDASKSVGILINKVIHGRMWEWDPQDQNADRWWTHSILLPASVPRLDGLALPPAEYFDALEKTCFPGWGGGELRRQIVRTMTRYGEIVVPRGSISEVPRLSLRASELPEWIMQKEWSADFLNAWFEQKLLRKLGVKGSGLVEYILE